MCEDTNKKNNIAIVVPCYNCSATLDSTVSSLLEQNDAESSSYEIILVDDGATDKTGELCDKYAADYPHIQVVHKENGGLVDAWKHGVERADAEYIAFCDADDYLSSDFISRISNIICLYEPDIIAYGMVMEYSAGDIDEQGILLPEGLYSETNIKDNLFRKLLSNGRMQSELVMPSRCNKVFKKALLMKIMDDIPKEISFGEDDITTFAALLNCTSIYAVERYYPYHYVRNDQSMTGFYDDKVFDKINTLYNALCTVEQKYKYQYHDQVLSSAFSTNLVYMKKEFHRNPGGYTAVKKKLKDVCAADIFSDGINRGVYKRYAVSSKFFTLLMKYRLFLIAYVLINFVEIFRGKKLQSS